MAAIDEKVKWPGWETVRLIGRGSFGGVYEIERDVFGHKEKAALKVITIPQSESDIDDLLSDGYDEESITTRFEGYLHDIVREYSMMADMKGCVNIVYCDDVKYIQHDNGIGWDIFIKMELLTPLTKALGKTVSDEQTIKIAADICSALAFCEKRNLLHRDIKPQNIFVSPDGTYKLGDFGIAKTAERTTSGTKTGTYKYMAPEVYNNQPYGSKADIYSLGLVLYWLLNERRTPFLPLPPQLPAASDEDRARTRRFSGETIPTPAHGSTELKRIVLKACAYDPKDRYQTADEMLHDLNALSVAEKPQGTPAAVPPVILPAEEAEEDKTVGAWTTPAAQPRPEEDKTVGAWAVLEKLATEAATQTEEDKTVGVWTQKPEVKKPEPAPKKKKKWWLAAVAAVAAIAAIAIVGTRVGGTAQTAPAPTSVHAAVPEPTATSKIPIVAVSAGEYHTIAVREDGTVVTAGPVDVSVPGWTDIVAVSTYSSNTVGLRSDGTVVSTLDGRTISLSQEPEYSYKVSEWSDIIAVAAGKSHAVGLRSDGTVVATGANRLGQCDVSAWKNIIAISACEECTVGLKSDGTVVSTWAYGDESQWKDIVSIAVAPTHVVGLKSDGTVTVAKYCEDDNRFDVSGWRDIIEISADTWYIVGLKADGTVVATGGSIGHGTTPPAWRDIVAVSAGGNHVVGLKSDGTVVADGQNEYGQCDVSDW